jgi:hypothetical protein
VGHVVSTGQKCIRSFDWEIGKARSRFEDLGLEGRNILKWSLKKGFEGINWIHLTPDRDFLVGFCAYDNDCSVYIKNSEFPRFEVLVAVLPRILICWDVIPCRVNGS